MMPFSKGLFETQNVSVIIQIKIGTNFGHMNIFCQYKQL
jgi:hypothetical protein